MSAEVYAFDIYGTLVDTGGLVGRLGALVGDDAKRVSDVWRTTQLAYSFRRAAMRDYTDFTTVTAQALDHALAATGHDAVARADRDGLLAEYTRLPAYDDVRPRSFKPDPVVYEHLVARVGSTPGGTTMVSSNPFDVIGARHAGLRAVWVRRSPAVAYDPWGVEPTRVVASLVELAG